MATKLFVLPGLSSPCANDNYRSAYQGVVDEAMGRGFEPELIYYPGQEKPDGSLDGVLSLTSALAHGCARVSCALAAGATAYRLIGFSFGCFVALRIAEQLEERPPQLVTLWGPLPFWKCWENFCASSKPHTGSGTHIIERKDFFRELLPIEYLIAQVRTPVRVCLGDRDEYAPPAFLTYLERGCAIGSEGQRHFHLVEGCSHTMMPTEPTWPKYADVLFRDT